MEPLSLKLSAQWRLKKNRNKVSIFNTNSIWFCLCYFTQCWYTCRSSIKNYGFSITREGRDIRCKQTIMSIDPKRIQGPDKCSPYSLYVNQEENYNGMKNRIISKKGVREDGRKCDQQRKICMFIYIIFLGHLLVSKY